MQILQEMDKNGDGRITSEELECALVQVGVWPKCWSLISDNPPSDSDLWSLRWARSQRLWRFARWWLRRIPMVSGWVLLEGLRSRIDAILNRIAVRAKQNLLKLEYLRDYMTIGTGKLEPPFLELECAHSSGGAVSRNPTWVSDYWEEERQSSLHFMSTPELGLVNEVNTLLIPHSLSQVSTTRDCAKWGGFFLHLLELLWTMFPWWRKFRKSDVINIVCVRLLFPSLGLSPPSPFSFLPSCIPHIGSLYHPLSLVVFSPFFFKCACT